MNRHILAAALIAVAASTAFAANPKGGITPEMLPKIKQAYQGTPADKAIHNAISNNDINKLVKICFQLLFSYTADVGVGVIECYVVDIVEICE